MFFDRDVRHQIKDNIKYNRDEQHESVKGSGGGGGGGGNNGSGKKSNNNNASVYHYSASRIKRAIRAALQPFRNLKKAPPPNSSR